MVTVNTVHKMHRVANTARSEGKKMALVPTMGALHKGHLSLVEEARRHADHVTVSIFVNPTQFGPSEDFEDYPRQVEDDLQKLAGIGGVDAVFAPTVKELYPYGIEQNATWVKVEQLDQHLCGRYREGHFLGVTTVVSKLFNACKPHFGVFGLKDAQQFLILKRMVEEMCMGIELVGVPTYREKDGLAASSRNVYLSKTHRQQAPAIQEALQHVRKRILEGEKDVETIRHHLHDLISSRTDGIVQYGEVVDVDFIQPIQRIKPGQDVLIAVAVFFDKTRLIDNVFVQAPGQS